MEQEDSGINLHTNVRETVSCIQLINTALRKQFHGHRQNQEHIQFTHMF